MPNILSNASLSFRVLINRTRFENILYLSSKYSTIYKSHIDVPPKHPYHLFLGFETNSSSSVASLSCERYLLTLEPSDV